MHGFVRGPIGRRISMAETGVPSAMSAKDVLTFTRPMVYLKLGRLGSLILIIWAIKADDISQHTIQR
jgi:hypothetical protein